MGCEPGDVHVKVGRTNSTEDKTPPSTAEACSGVRLKTVAEGQSPKVGDRHLET